jgi:enamine deaminase RidA (YjgF/YER057c/UK114 family)
MIRNPSGRMVKLIGAVLAVVWLSTFPTLERTAAQQAPQRRYFQSTGSLAGLPFSDAVLVGNTLYVAGHIGVDDASGQAPADLDQEVQLLLERFRATLAQAGMKMDNLVSVDVYCTDLSLYDKFRPRVHWHRLATTRCALRDAGRGREVILFHSFRRLSDA